MPLELAPRLKDIIGILLAVDSSNYWYVTALHKYFTHFNTRCFLNEFNIRLLYDTSLIYILGMSHQHIKTNSVIQKQQWFAKILPTCPAIWPPKLTNTKHLQSNNLYLRKKACQSVLGCLMKCSDMVEDFVEKSHCSTIVCTWCLLRSCS